MEVFNYLRAPLRSAAVRACLCFVSFWIGGAAAASATPVIINYPFSANPGDVISLGGSGFGTAPTVYLKPSKQTATTTLATKTANDGAIVAQVPKTAALDLYELWVSNGSAASAHVVLNAPHPMHFDNAEVVSGLHFRIFGRNLYVNGKAPTVTLIDMQTNAQLTATVAIATTSAYSIDAVAPSGVIAGHTYQASVSNYYATALTDTTILGHAPGTDYFAIGQAWAFDFKYADGPTYKAGVKGTNQADHHVFNVKTDPSLTQLAKGDGKTNDTSAIQAAVKLASVNGGVVYLPAGTYNIGANFITMASNVVLQGAGASTTKIIMGPAGPAGFYIPPGSQMIGFYNLAVQNVDLSSNYIYGIGSANQSVSKVFVKSVTWNFGSGKGFLFGGDRIAILNSTFTQAINYQNGDPTQKTGGLGPIYLTPATNLQFKNNTIGWATDQNRIVDLVNAVIENNTFTRSASDIITVGPAQLSWTNYNNVPLQIGQKIQRVMGRQLALAFGKNVVLQNNTFAVSGGTLKYNWCDGETIQNEAGGQHPREDSATVTAADASSITDNAKCSGVCAWNVYPNSMIVVVSGAGAGQWRRITGNNGNTFTVDKPFDVIPVVGDHFTISVPAFENALIRGNKMSNNPMGIDLYHGAFLNVSVISNALTNNGGIDLVPTQRNVPDPIPAGVQFSTFSASRNIEINGNTLTNSTGLFPSFIAISQQFNTQTTFWGKNTIGIEARNNQIVARAGTPGYRFVEGYQHFSIYQNSPAPYLEQGTGGMYGTVFQGNKCTNCPVSYTLDTGTIDATIWNPITVTTPGIASILVKDYAFTKTTTTPSIGTLVGHD